MSNTREFSQARDCHESSRKVRINRVQADAEKSGEEIAGAIRANYRCCCIRECSLERSQRSDTQLTKFCILDTEGE
jgi:hypothetical protein